MDVLFQGNANKVNTVYSLTNPITNYRLVIVKIRAYTNDGGSYDTSVVVAEPTYPSSYGIITAISEQSKSTSMYFNFTAGKSLLIGQINFNSVTTGLEIVKIYGIK